jgi:hypothetical protein
MGSWRRECGVRTFLVDFSFIFRTLKFVEGKKFYFKLIKSDKIAIVLYNFVCQLHSENSLTGNYLR